ncbi:hypothetical protein [Microbacterium memoriense]|uniref:KTSC domain-containing protein n=1 Tax=Microbacterium memoriense TaxID=2978350 RepID=A0ABT2PAU5_9MICO|nr:hypothetical protein [Microbacterium memoriense]MCT9001729.1 hypothetical protein [Microbacterium memoriense]
MNSPHTRLALTTSFMLAAAITIFGIVPAAVATVDDSDTKEPAASTSLLQARLSITTDFDKALRIAETYEGAAVGVRFENDQVVGEYFFDSDKSPAEFMKQFADMYGTVPQVAALVASVPYRAPSTSQDATLRATTFKPLPEIQVEGDPFIAAPIPAEKLEDLRSTARGSSPIEMAVPSSGTSNAARAIVPTWQPQTVYAGTVRGGSSQYFYNSID